MNKFKILFLLSLIFFSAFGFAQTSKVEFLIKNDSLPKKEKKYFTYLDKQTDVSKAMYIGRIKSEAKNTGGLFAVDHGTIFSLLQRAAQRKGANSFRLVSYQKNENVDEIVLDLYVIDEPTREQNASFLPQSKVYFFGRQDFDPDNQDANVEKYQLNGEEKTLEADHYQVVDLDKEMTIKKGKVLGASLTLDPENHKNGESIYVNFQGFGALPSYNGATGGFGLSFSSGKIFQMEKDFALLLTNIYLKQE